MNVHHYLTHSRTLRPLFAKHLFLIPIQLHPVWYAHQTDANENGKKDENRTEDNRMLKSEEGFTKQTNKLKNRIVLVPQQKERDKKITFIETEPAQECVHSLTHPHLSSSKSFEGFRTTTRPWGWSQPQQCKPRNSTKALTNSNSLNEIYISWISSRFTRRPYTYMEYVRVCRADNYSLFISSAGMNKAHECREVSRTKRLCSAPQSHRDPTQSNARDTW